MNTKPQLDSTFYVFGYRNSSSASLAQWNNMCKLESLAVEQFYRLIPAYRRGEARYGVIEDYFADTIFLDAVDLMDRSKPLPLWLKRLLDHFSDVHFLSATAVRFYLAHKLAFPGEPLGTIARRNLPKALGTNLTIPVLEPRTRAA